MATHRLSATTRKSAGADSTTSWILSALLIFLVGIQVYGFQRSLAKPQDTDFGTFWDSTQSFLSGQSLYFPALTNMNPPHFVVALLPLAWLDERTALILWSLCGVMTACASLAIIIREAGIVCLRERILLLIGLSGCSLTTVTLDLGQTTFLLMLPMTVVWRAERRGRGSYAAFILGLCAAIKPFLLAFAFYYMVRRAWRSLALFALAGMAVAACGLIVFGVDAYMDWLHALSRTELWAWGNLNASALGLLARLLTPETLYAPLLVAPSWVRPAWLVVAVMTTGVLIRALRTSTVDQSFALVLFYTTLVSPLGWMYYLLLPLGPFVSMCRAWPASYRIRLWWLAAPGLIWPGASQAVLPNQPLATLTLQSVYFWAVLVLFVGTLCSPVPDVEAPAEQIVRKGRFA